MSNRPSLTRRAYVVLLLMGIATVFAVATGFTPFWRLLYILALVLGAALLWAQLSLWRLNAWVDRRTAHARVGEHADERVWVRNNAPLPKGRLEVEDQTDLPGHAPGRIVSISGHTVRSWRARTLCRRRGVYTMGPLVVHGGDPFGLFQRSMVVPGTHQLIIFPRTVPLPYFHIHRSELPGEGQRQIRSLATTPQASGVREYSHGDSLHRVHWPTSLRLGQLMSKEFDEGFGAETWIFLDMEARVQADSGEDSTDETLATVAASVSGRLLETQMPVGLMAYGRERTLVEPQWSGAHRYQILEALAHARADGNVPLGEALAAEERHFTRFSTLLLLTSSSDDEWMTAVHVLLQRRVRVVVVLVDASSFGGSHSPDGLVPGLERLGVPVTVIKQGEDLGVALQRLLGSVGVEEAVSRRLVS